MGFEFTGYCQWRQLRGGFNWYTVTPLALSLDYDKVMSHLTIDLGLLGFVLQLVFYSKSARAAQDAQIEDMLKEMKGFRMVEVTKPKGNELLN